MSVCVGSYSGFEKGFAAEAAFGLAAGAVAFGLACGGPGAHFPGPTAWISRNWPPPTGT